MTERISRRQVLAGAAAVGSAPLIVPVTAEAAPAGHHPKPPADIRAMLREISSRNIERTILKLVSFGTRSTLSSQDDPTRGIGAARDWLLAEFQKAAAPSGGRMTVELQSYIQDVAPRIPVPTRITNVVATLRGDRPDSAGRHYVVSGHYDSMPTNVVDFTSDAPGANDDASGVAAVLEMARVMATRKFDATLVFMAVAGEEQGLFGANHYATLAKANGIDVAGMFTNDIIGSSRGGAGERDPFSIRVFAEGLANPPSPLEADWRRFGGGETESAARQLARYVKEVAENESTRMKVRIIYRRDRLGRGGDHIPFLQQGYPAVRFTEPNEDYRHQHQDVRVENGVQLGDLPEFVDFDYIARAARVNAAAMAALSRAPAVPTGAVINTAGLRSDTELRWNAGTEGDLAGYHVVMRSTTDLEWERTIDVGAVTSVVLPNTSKDNFFFGIRAVDKSGNRSPVAFPRPMT
jgi:Peptidase family M28